MTSSNPYRNVDGSAEPESAVSMMDAVREREEIATLKRRSIELLALPSGGAALDLGCGTGEEVIALAHAVGPGGRAVGLDASETMLGSARERAAAAGVTAEFRKGDAAALPFADGEFDGVRTERMLIHVESPAAVIGEMMRVTRPGGRVVAGETDFGSLVIDIEDRRLFRRMSDWREDAWIRNGWMGRQLFRRFVEAGLRDVTIEPFVILSTGAPTAYAFDRYIGTAREACTAGAVTQAETDAFVGALEAARDAGVWCSTAIIFLAGGTVP